MVTHPFVVGFLVAELPKMFLEKELHDIKERPFTEKSFALANSLDIEPLGFPSLKDEPVEMMKFTRDQILNSLNITKSLAMAYVMDQVGFLCRNMPYHQYHFVTLPLRKYYICDLVDTEEEFSLGVSCLYLFIVYCF